jgi:hypothetical protein
LPVSEATPIVSLGEGSTPLVFAPRLSERIDCRVLIKCEGLNPTGSFKDRGMTVAVSKAVECGAQAFDLRFDWEHFRLRCGLRGARGHSLCGRFTGRQNRQWQTGAGNRSWRANRIDQR